MTSTTKPLTLHAHATGPNPIKIAMALEFLSIPYTIKMWDFGDDAEKGVKGTSFTAINENGRVPALEDPNTGVVSWESGAVMNYVRRVYDKEGKLGPRGKEEQDVVDLEKWEYFLLSTLGPMTGECGISVTRVTSSGYVTWLLTFVYRTGELVQVSDVTHLARYGKKAIDS